MTGNPTRDLVLTRVFEAPLEQVWKAWSDPQYVMRWWGPTGFSCPLAQMDFRPGGTSLVCMRAPKEYGGRDMYNTWTYQSILLMQQIEFIQHFTDSGGNQLEPAAIGLPPGIPKEVRHLISFKDLGGGQMELTVTEYGYTTDQVVELSRAGLEQCLDMAAIFAKG